MFLEVKFHDNDFGIDFMTGLEEIWKRLVKERGRDELRTNTEIFQFLHKKNVLKPVIIRVVAAISIKDSVMWALDGMNTTEKYYSKPKWIDDPKDHYVDTDFYLKYFDNIELEFHDNGDFCMKDQNGEHFWLDLENGNVGVF